MQFKAIRRISMTGALSAAVVLCLAGGFLPSALHAQASSSSSKDKQSSSSTKNFQQEKAPTLMDPAGPTVSLISLERVFLIASALNACGYNQGLVESAPVRKRVRD